MYYILHINEILGPGAFREAGSPMGVPGVWGPLGAPWYLLGQPSELYPLSGSFAARTFWPCWWPETAISAEIEPEKVQKGYENRCQNCHFSLSAGKAEILTKIHYLLHFSHIGHSQK